MLNAVILLTFGLMLAELFIYSNVALLNQLNSLVASFRFTCQCLS